VMAIASTPSVNAISRSVFIAGGLCVREALSVGSGRFHRICGNHGY